MKNEGSKAHSYEKKIGLENTLSEKWGLKDALKEIGLESALYGRRGLESALRKR